MAVENANVKKTQTFVIPEPAFFAGQASLTSTLYFEAIGTAVDGAAGSTRIVPIMPPSSCCRMWQ